MNIRRTISAAAASLLSLSAVNVSAQEAKSVTIDLTTNICHAEAEINPGIYGKNLGNIFNGLSGETLGFNFDVKVTLPEKYSDSDYVGSFENVANRDGKHGYLVIEGSDAAGNALKKKVLLKINEKGFYELSIAKDGETASKNQLAADYFANVNDISFEGIISFDTAKNGGYLLLPQDAILEITDINWQDKKIEAFDKLISAEEFTVKGAEGEAVKGFALEKDRIYDINELHEDAKIAISDTIAMNKGATLTFNFLTEDELKGLGWHDIGSDIELLPELDVSQEALKKVAIGLNLDNTRLMQQTGIVSENKVTFSWDKLLLKSAGSFSSGDIDSIHIRAGADMVLGSITIDIPKLESEDNTLGAGNETEDELIISDDAAKDDESDENSPAESSSASRAAAALVAIPVAAAAAVLSFRKRKS